MSHIAGGALLLGAVLVGCAGEASYVCSDGVFGEVRYSDPVDCALSREVTGAARDTLQSTGVWAHVDLSSTVLVVHPRGRWRSDVLGIEVDGQYSPGVIETGPTYESLVHECLHAKDYLECDLPRLLAPRHTGWDTDGRDAAIRTWRETLRARGLLR